MFRIMTRILPIVLAIAMLMALPTSLLASPARQAQQTLKVWHYEPPDSAMGISWDGVIKDFQAKYPNVKVEFELKQFEQIRATANMILNSDEAPDVMELNKGNAFAGLYSKEGLLTDLTQVAKDKGWDKIMSPSVQTTCLYDEKGIMGSGKLYGVTNYGEFVMVYYNKAMFDKYKVKLPTTLDELEAIADTFHAAGITPFALGAKEYPSTQLFYELALYKANRDFVTNYQLLKGELDFHGPEFTYAADKVVDYVKKGYVDKVSTGLTGQEMANLFISGKTPMVLTGSWFYAQWTTQIKDFEWGIFLMPGKKLNTGSGGNLWVVPAKAKNKDMAYEFINMTLDKKAQTAMANAGGIPINADLTQIKDAKVQDLNKTFATVVENDGLSFYPDWPAPGYYDVLVANLQELIGGTKTPKDFLDAIAAPYNEYKATLK